jgi:hypothetical protein
MGVDGAWPSAQGTGVVCGEGRGAGGKTPQGTQLVNQAESLAAPGGGSSARKEIPKMALNCVTTLALADREGIDKGSN